MSTERTSSTGGRLAAYAALAGTVIPVAANAELIGETGLNLVATPGSPVAVDFGEGFGEIFRFSVSTFFTSSDRAARVGSYYSYFYSTQVVQFDNGNTGGWTGASIVDYNGAADPMRFGNSAAIGAAENWDSMSSFFGFDHVLAYLFSSYSYFYARGGGFFSTTFGDWAPNERGYLGFRISDDGGSDFLYGWIDVEADLDILFRGGAGSITIHGWGLETTPNQPIVTPTPGPVGIGLLAMGAAGIRRTRSRRAA